MQFHSRAEKVTRCWVMGQNRQVSQRQETHIPASFRELTPGLRLVAMGQVGAGAE